MARNQPLSLPEEVLLLALRDEAGTIEMGSLVPYALGGAALAELLMRNRIRLEKSTKDRPVSLVNAKPVGEPFLDDCLGRIRLAKKKGTAKTWITRFANLKNLRHQLALRLCDRGILRAEEDKVLLLFTRRIYPEIDPRPERALVERLRQAIFTETDRLDTRTVVLVSLAESAGLLKNVFDQKDLAGRKDRIARIVSGDAAGAATREAIEAVQAAVFVAGIMPTIITTAVH